jgi:hypothetical protein
MLRKILPLVSLLLVGHAFADDFLETQKHEFPVPGITLDIPKASSLANTLSAGLLFEYWNADKSLGMSVSLAPLNNPSADQYASQMALQLHGIKTLWDEKIEGEPAYRVNVPVRTGKCTVRTSLVTASKGRAILFTAFGADADKAEEAARQLAHSASLSDPESPADHTDFSPKIGFAFGEPSARVIISAPEWLHVAKSAGKQLMLSGYDFTSGKEAFIAVFDYVDVPPGMHVADFAAHMVPQMKARFGDAEKDLWASLPENAKIYISPALQPTQTNSKGPNTYKLALAEVAPGRILNMAFMINTDDADQTKSYADLAAAIIKNVKILSASPVVARPPMAAPAGPPAPTTAAAAEEK